MYEQEQTLYTFHQNDIRRNQWYKNLNTWSNIENAIGVTRQQKALFEHVAQEKHGNSFENITGKEKNSKNECRVIIPRLSLITTYWEAVCQTKE